MNNKKNFYTKNFGDMLIKYNYNIHPGDIVAGTIFHKEIQGFLVDIGINLAGYLPKEEILLNSNNINKETVKYLINETREFFIIAYNHRSKQLILSIKRLDYIRARKRIQQLAIEDIILYLQIKNINRGGIITYLEGLQSFIPKSHLIANYNSISSINNIIQCKLLINNEKINQIILSTKRAALDISSKKLKIGNIVNGEITQITKYGVFIKIYNIISLLHISEIGDKHINNIYKVFEIGKELKVKIIHIDMEQGRLSVSRRNLD